MSETLFRTASLGCGPGSGRELFGVAVPYNQTAEVSDATGGGYLERFAPGCFARSITQRGHKVRLLTGHDHRRLPVGKAVELVERPDGLHVSFKVAETPSGDEVLTLVRDGLVDSFSVGFQPIAHHWEDGTLVRTEAALREVSVVCEPAYAGAVIEGVRQNILGGSRFRAESSELVPRSLAEARLALLDW
ncbi:Prophage protease [Mycobacterium canetti]|uniref:HK97 family phage prohead protease n=1 Tax=Mycobacterium canetti TaxID=78331 RepID=UPI002D788000|nr:HK97 family phage prohead protease [Mycobacterium canetti]WRO41761.1 Prophage protease [Mycobacterium canetti]